MAAKKKNTEGLAFITDTLKKNPSASYGDIKAGADKRGLTVYPIMYGRAQALLGIVKSKKRGAAKKRVSKRGPGRPRKSSAAAPVAGPSGNAQNRPVRNGSKPASRAG